MNTLNHLSKKYRAVHPLPAHPRAAIPRVRTPARQVMVFRWAFKDMSLLQVDTLTLRAVGNLGVSLTRRAWREEETI